METEFMIPVINVTDPICNESGVYLQGVIAGIVISSIIGMMIAGFLSKPTGNRRIKS